MDDSQRGKIRNRALAQRIMDYSQLRWGDITPTDVDAFVEFENRCFVIIEAKGEGVKVKRGQFTALKRMLLRLDQPWPNCSLPESRAILIIADCNNDTLEDVILSECLVREAWKVVRNDEGDPLARNDESQKGRTVLEVAREFVSATLRKLTGKGRETS